MHLIGICIGPKFMAHLALKVFRSMTLLFLLSCCKAKIRMLVQRNDVEAPGATKAGSSYGTGLHPVLRLVYLYPKIFRVIMWYIPVP